MSDDAGSDSSLSDGAPVGNFAKKSETVGQLAKKKTKTKKKKKPKGKVALNSGAKLKMAHTEGTYSLWTINTVFLLLFLLSFTLSLMHTHLQL